MRVKINDLSKDSAIDRNVMKSIVGGSTLLSGYQPCAVSKTLDQSSTPLYQSICSGEVLGPIVIEFIETENTSISSLPINWDSGQTVS